MSRPTIITDEQILEAARAVFLAEGFGAQTAKIARLAGVSEGSIFKRFPTKEALFYAALQIPQHPEWHHETESLVGAGALKENLVTVAMGVLTHLHATLPRVITTLGSRVAHPPGGPFHGLPEPPPVRDARIISQYLAREIELGRLAPCDPQRVAQILLGSLLHHVFGRFTAQKNTTPEELRVFAQGVVDVLWDGIAPR